MKNRFRKSVNFSVTSCAVLLGSLLVNACGGGGGDDSETSAGIGGTGIVFGKITAFGSVYVNGTRFNTDNSQFIVDGSSATQDDLEIGMVVLLQVETERGVYTGNAISVEYDDDVQGPVAATPELVVGSGGNRKTFDVFGQTITIDQTGTVFDSTSFAGLNALEALDLVEVSGFRTSTTEITATFVRKIGVLEPGVSEVELSGEILALDTTLMQFTLDGTVINYGTGTEIEVSGPLVNGLNVEVDGVIQVDSSVLADEIEDEKIGFGSEAEDVSIQGIISSYNSNADFVINGQAVDASQAEFSPTTAAGMLDVGVEIEVEGDIVGGILIADEVELREGESGVEAYVDPGSVDTLNNSFTVSFASLGNVMIKVNAQTIIEDEAGMDPLQNMTLNDLMGNDYVRVEGFGDGNDIIASTVKRTDPEDSLKLEGVVDDYEEDMSITVLGIVYALDLATTSYDPFPPNIQIGDIVEIEDEDPADGIADKVEEEF